MENNESFTDYKSFCTEFQSFLDMNDANASHHSSRFFKPSDMSYRDRMPLFVIQEPSQILEESFVHDRTISEAKENLRQVPVFATRTKNSIGFNNLPEVRIPEELKKTVHAIIQENERLKKENLEMKQDLRRKNEFSGNFKTTSSIKLEKDSIKMASGDLDESGFGSERNNFEKNKLQDVQMTLLSRKIVELERKLKESEKEKNHLEKEIISLKEQVNNSEMMKKNITPTPEQENKDYDLLCDEIGILLLEKSKLQDQLREYEINNREVLQLRAENKSLRYESQKVNKLLNELTKTVEIIEREKKQAITEKNDLIQIYEAKISEFVNKSVVPFTLNSERFPGTPAKHEDMRSSIISSPYTDSNLSMSINLKTS